MAIKEKLQKKGEERRNASTTYLSHISVSYVIAIYLEFELFIKAGSVRSGTESGKNINFTGSTR